MRITLTNEIEVKAPASRYIVTTILLDGIPYGTLTFEDGNARWEGQEEYFPRWEAVARGISISSSYRDGQESVSPFGPYTVHTRLASGGATSYGKEWPTAEQAAEESMVHEMREEGASFLRYADKGTALPTNLGRFLTAFGKGMENARARLGGKARPVRDGKITGEPSKW
jgi:hypothetical protein